LDTLIASEWRVPGAVSIQIRGGCCQSTLEGPRVAAAVHRASVQVARWCENRVGLYTSLRSMPSRSLALISVPLAAAVCGLAALHIFAPEYLFGQGFPLDDAWIHAVYARELARSGALAYNPGVLATGETSPLWAIVLALPHAVADDSTAVLLTKLVGFAMHAASAVIVALAIRDACGKGWLVPASGGVLVALHPHLVAASVSGMEVPLATLFIALGTLAVVRANAPLAASVGAAAFLARPESAAMVVLLPLFYWIRTQPRVALKLSLYAFLGALFSVVVIGARNALVSGMPLPATFYAKTNASSLFDLHSQSKGFRQLLGQMPPLHLAGVYAVLAAVCGFILMRRQTTSQGRLAAALYLSGVGFCAISFALVRPVDPPAFYHQRYVLPALLPIVAALPLLAHELLRRWLERGTHVRTNVAVGVVAVVICALLLASAPGRYRRLSNDTRNIDDVQVAFGRALATAPAAATAWVVDAGASRYFGRAFVVDLMGLNTFELLKPGAQAFLDRHPPSYLDLFPRWSSIEPDQPSSFRSRSFVTSTPYTVTSSPAMRQHTLVTCEPGSTGRITVKGRTYAFRCASETPSVK
jgi:hypothetical protein